MPEKTLVALAGQPNAGKSTLFNMLTGARQHVANYPGVTVEKKTGGMRFDGRDFEIVDLPGTYSLSSWSLEERVARDFIVREQPAVVVNVADASNLKRHLFLTFQLLEMGLPVVVALNMMDVADKRGVRIDAQALAEKLGVPVIPTVGRKGEGRKALREALAASGNGGEVQALRVDYGPLEPALAKLTQSIQVVAGRPGIPLPRWLAVKLLEGDNGVTELLTDKTQTDPLLVQAQELAQAFEREHGVATPSFIEQRRYQFAEILARECVLAPGEGAATLSDKADRIICHRVLGYPILFAVLYLMYWLSIEQGYELTNYTWPILAGVRDFIANLLPAEGFISDPMLRSLILWIADSVNALLNYVPIFLILFAYISFLEDLGYMPRMAFLLDAFFRRYGLHGQSTLPLVLGGVYVGGCAVPGVMACRAVPDERARLATILVVPMMNCLAKVPLYVLLIGAYFASAKGPALFFIATITVLLALTTAKLLNLTVLRNKESAPFIMEMPPYHLPTLGGVLRRALERVWLYVRKITTIVAAVSVVLFVLMQFPGISQERRDDLKLRADAAQAAFFQAAAKSSRTAAMDTPEEIDRLFDFEQRYKSARTGLTDKAKAEAVDARFQAENQDFFGLVKPRGKEDKTLSRAFKKLRRERLTLRKESREATIDRSFLGVAGRSLEPITRFAGFNWRVNVALLSALAAKENTVATLGALYQPEEGAGDAETETEAPAQGQKALEQRMAEQETGFTPLHALALMLFMALYPPCMAATMMVKVQSGSWKWMLFSLVYMMGLGMAVAMLVFSGGTVFGLSGNQAMAWFYGLALAGVVVTGLMKPMASET